jgi:cobalamin-dependent methionine synthase I
MLFGVVSITNPKTSEAIYSRDKIYIQKMVVAQKNGVLLDIGPLKDKDSLLWLIEVTKEVTNVPIALCSMDIESLEQGLRVLPPKTIINGCDACSQRTVMFMELAKKYDALLICSLVNYPKTPAEMVIAVLDTAKDVGFPVENIIIDPINAKDVETIKSLNEPPLLVVGEDVIFGK